LHVALLAGYAYHDGSQASLRNSRRPHRSNAAPAVSLTLCNAAIIHGHAALPSNSRTLHAPSAAPGRQEAQHSRRQTGQEAQEEERGIRFGRPAAAGQHGMVVRCWEAVQRIGTAGDGAAVEKGALGCTLVVVARHALEPNCKCLR